MSISALTLFKSLRTTNPSFLKISEMYRNSMGYRQMGLVYDDLIPDEGELVQEALRRLTPEQYYERVFRFRRALNLSLKKEELPKEHWTTAEADVAYLRPIIQQLELELETSQNFDNLEIPEALKNRNRV